MMYYRVTHLLMNLGWIDFDFGCSTLSLILPGLMGNWQNWLSSWARWWNITNPSHSNPGSPWKWVTLFINADEIELVKHTEAMAFLVSAVSEESSIRQPIGPILVTRFGGSVAFPLPLPTG